MADVTHKAIVEKLLSTKALDFKAIGDAVSELGPSLALQEEPWDVFCGTMRTFIHVYRMGGIDVGQVERLAELKNIANKELRG